MPNTDDELIRKIAEEVVPGEENFSAILKLVREAILADFHAQWCEADHRLSYDEIKATIMGEIP